VAAKVAKRASEDGIAAKGNDVLLRVYLYGGVFDEGVEEVCRHALVDIPISGLVLKSCKEKFISQGHRLTQYPFFTEKDGGIYINGGNFGGLRKVNRANTFAGTPGGVKRAAAKPVWFSVGTTGHFLILV
jgi:hypothetical protein